MALITKVPVYIIPDSLEYDNKKSEAVASIFSDPLFVVMAPDISDPLTLNPTVEFPLEKKLELYRTLWCLKDAKEKFSSYPVIIIKDTSVSNVRGEEMGNIIKYICNNLDIYSLNYLCKWSDKCQLYTDKLKIQNTNNTLVKTHSPYGMQAILFSVKGRNILLGQTVMTNGKVFQAYKPLSIQLNKEVSEGNIDASTVIPNIIDFNVLYARNNNDYVKSQMCTRIKNIVAEDNNSRVVWFVIIIIIIIILAWMAIRVSNKINEK